MNRAVEQTVVCLVALSSLCCPEAIREPPSKSMAAWPGDTKSRRRRWERALTWVTCS